MMKVEAQRALDINDAIWENVSEHSGWSGWSGMIPYLWVCNVAGGVGKID